MRETGAYLITGGLGGLGRFVARWLVERGAKTIVLVGRSAPTEEANRAIERLGQMGAMVTVVRGDIANSQKVDEIMARFGRDLPPLRGIVHAAGVLDDGVIEHQSWDRFRRVLAPKVLGAWSLHRSTARSDLDFFLAFSSLASLFGSPGQSNYAAANAYLDALAHRRRALGLCALSINWGSWSDIGIAARSETVSRFAQRRQGLSPISPALGSRFLDQCLLLSATHNQIGAVPVDWSRFVPSFFRDRAPPLLSDLLIAAAESSPSTPKEVRRGIRSELRSAPTQVYPKVLEYICARVAEVGGLSSPDEVDPDCPLLELGIDSLMSVELRNTIQLDLGNTCQLPSTLVFRYPTAAALARCVADLVLKDMQTPALEEDGYGSVAEVPVEEGTIE